MRSVLVWLMVLFCATFPAPTHAAPCHPAELFATDNTDPLFGTQADVTLALNGTAVTARTIIAIMENFQDEAGSIAVPEALWDFGAPRRLGDVTNSV